METLFEELKRYVLWGPEDEAALRGLHPLAAPDFERIADEFYRRILDHAEARKALEGGERQVGRLKITMREWLDLALSGPWDEAYYERRARIGRMHVRIALPQHYMFGAMNVIRQQLLGVIVRDYVGRRDEARQAITAVEKLLDLELAIMLHTYREDLVAQQARSERLATFGQLVASIGHELRNPLGVMESSLYILRGRLDDERARKHADRIGQQLGVANQIISDLLDLIRDRPQSRAPVDLADVLEQAAAAVTRPPGVTLTIQGVAGLPSVPGDAGMLRQAFVNLLENATHAVGAEGSIRVRGAREGDGVVLVVEDNGPGVDPAVRARIFEPLITTKARGIGLGLPLVRRIIARHGGAVSHEPLDPHGARFVVSLPVGASDA
jgi:signal transduction histidine kinase